MPADSRRDVLTGGRAIRFPLGLPLPTSSWRGEDTGSNSGPDGPPTIFISQWGLNVLILWSLVEISPECSLEGLMLKLKLQYFGHLMPRVDSLEKTLKLGKAGGEGDDRG